MPSNRLAVRLALCGLAFTCLNSTAQTASQTATSLHGTVRDPLGALVANARVELLENASVVASTSTLPDGSYALAIPAAHTYRLRISASTFRTTLTEPVFLSPTQTQTEDLTLATPTLTEQVTVTATGTPTPLAESGAPISVLTDVDYPHSPEIQQPLRLVPGVQMTQAGGAGSQTSLYIRGGDSNYNKVLLDGVPVSDIGGIVNFANFASAGISQIEVLRQPNSVLYGSDALSGVVELSSARGTTPLPLVSYAIDGGNLGLLRQEAVVSGVQTRLDYLAGFARLQTANSTPDDQFHNATAYGNVGFTPDSRTDLRFTFRHLNTNSGAPNAIAFFGIPDFANQFEQDTFLNAVASQQTTSRWHNLVRFGHEALNSQFTQYAANGTLYTPAGSTYANGYLGLPETITGANGYSVTGTAILDYEGTYPATYPSSARRSFVYAQTDYHLTPHVGLLGAFNYEAESGKSSGASVSRGNYSYTLQLAGDVRSRLFYLLGSGIESNAVYGKALTPRASLAFYARRPDASHFFSGTKLHGSFGKGVKESNVYQQANSLYGTFASLPDGPALIARYGTRPLGAEYSRTFDAGVEQQFGAGKARLNLSYFHNRYTNGIQSVSQEALIALGVTAANDPNFAYGAYVNSQAFRSQGVEAEGEFRLTRNIFARAGYTYLDAVVERSFSSDAFYGGSINPAFPTIAIGAYAPLVGQRPFRRAPHSGYFALGYTHSRLDTQISGSLVGRRDDSTFLFDQDFGSTLLLPNRNLDGAYQRLELSADYRINSHLTTFANLQNLLNEHYFEAFGYPALPFNVRGGVRISFGGESLKLH